MGIEKKTGEELVQKISHKIKDAERVLIISHKRPDGDAVGSLLGMGLSLQAAGKQVQMVLTDGTPGTFDYLPGSQLIHKDLDGDFDLSIVLDCSDINRMGDLSVRVNMPDINIDHHPTNLAFARLNYIDSDAVATAEILANLLPGIGLTVTPGVAACLMTGIITDTLGFRTNNVTPHALRTVADLMEINDNMPELYRQALLKHSYEALRYWGIGLSKLHRQDRLIWTTLSLADRQTVSYPGNDDADLISVLTTIEDAEVYILFIEQNKNRVKVSWRSQPGIDVSKIALLFGGGGHKAAAGAEVDGDIDEVQNQVLVATRSIIDGI